MGRGRLQRRRSWNRGQWRSETREAAEEEVYGEMGRIAGVSVGVIEV